MSPGSRRALGVAGGIAGGAAVFAGITLLARAAGFGRWLVFSGSVSAQCVGNAYSTANQLPNVLFEVVAGGALAGAVVPLLAGPLSRSLAPGAGPEHRAEVDRTASALLTWAVAVLTPLALLRGAARRSAGAPHGRRRWLRRRHRAGGPDARRVRPAGGAVRGRRRARRRAHGAPAAGVAGARPAAVVAGGDGGVPGVRAHRPGCPRRRAGAARCGGGVAGVGHDRRCRGDDAADAVAGALGRRAAASHLRASRPAWRGGRSRSPAPAW